MDHSSRPKRTPTAIGDDVVDAIMELRKREKWGAARIAAYLEEKGIEVSASTVHRTLKRNQISRVRDMDPPTGEPMRIVRYEHERPGDMVHVDIKKVGRIPKGGGWAVHGQGTEEARASKRKAARTGKVGYAYLHSAVDDYSRFAYTEVLDDEKGTTAAEFWLRAAEYFAQHGIAHIERVLTDNGSPYRSRAFNEALEVTGTRHKFTRPYTPRTNGKVERYNQTMVAEWLRRRPYDSEQDRTRALAEFLNYYNFDRRHSALGWLPPITRVPLVVRRSSHRSPSRSCWTPHRISCRSSMSWTVCRQRHELLQLATGDQPRPVPPSAHSGAGLLARLLLSAGSVAGRLWQLERLE